MSKRLGEILIDRGLLNDRQLEEALHGQLISGGHLGTSLLDLGYVDEDSLGEALAEIYRIDRATVDDLREIPGHVIRALPASLAEKHSAIPIRLDGGRLHLAVVAPRSLGTLSSATGFRIVPMVAPEVRILEALETYYGVARRPRFVRVSREMEARSRQPQGAAAVSAVAVSRVVAECCPPEQTIVIPGEAEGYGTDWREVARELHLDDDDEPADPYIAPPAVERRLRRNNSPFSRRIEDVLDRMCSAEHKEELSEAVLDFTRPHMKHCILFSVRSQLARIWDCRGVKLPLDRLRRLSWPIAGGAIFSLLLGEQFYRGPVDGSDPKVELFYRSLELEPPEEVLLYPVYLDDWLVAVFYGDNGTEKIQGESEPHIRLGTKLTLALNLLLLKMKIRTL